MLWYIAIDCIFIFNNKNIIIYLIILNSYVVLGSSAPCLLTLNYVASGKGALMDCTSISFHKLCHWCSYGLSPFLSWQVLLKCLPVSEARARLEQGHDKIAIVHPLSSTGDRSLSSSAARVPGKMYLPDICK